jgi:hypothetical protein
MRIIIIQFLPHPTALVRCLSSFLTGTSRQPWMQKFQSAASVSDSDRCEHLSGKNERPQPEGEG